MPARHLRLVDVESGEVVSDTDVTKLQEAIESLEAQVKSLEMERRTQRGKITRLERNIARERLDYVDRPKIEAVHSYWQRRTGSKGALTPARFDAVKGILEQKKPVMVGSKQRWVLEYEYPADFKRAIDGYWSDHYEKARKNGSIQHFYDLELICRDGSHFEEGIARCPQPKPRPFVPRGMDLLLR